MLHFPLQLTNSSLIEKDQAKFSIFSLSSGTESNPEGNEGLMAVNRKSGSCGSLVLGSPWGTFTQGPLKTQSAEGISTLAIFYS